MERASFKHKIASTEPSYTSKQKILTAAVELFYEQGYEKTTMRQIIQKAGVLNGSLYYFFKGKDNILESIVTEQLNMTFAYADKKLKETDNPMMVLLFPLAIELYTAEHSKKAADLLFHAHSSTDITDVMVTMIHDWVFEHYPQYKEQIMSKEFKLNFLAIVSLMRSFLGQFAKGTNEFHYGDCLKVLIKTTSVFFQIPLFNVEHMSDDICKKVETEKIIIGNEYLQVEIHDIDDSKNADQLNLSSEAR